MQMRKQSHRNFRLKVLVVCTFCVTFFFGCSSDKPAGPKSLLSVSDKPELEILARAMDNYDRGMYNLSREAWSDLSNTFPNTYYSTLADLKIADSYYFSESYSEALVAYEEYLKLHRGHEAIPYVYYQMANCHFQQYRGVAHDQTPLKSVIQLSEQLLKEFPESLYANVARENIEKARSYLKQYEAFVAYFYERQGMTEAAEKRRAKISKIDNTAPEGPLATPVLIFAHRALSDQEVRQQTLASVPAVAAETGQDETEQIEDPSSEILQRLSCERFDNTLVFTAFLQIPMNIDTVPTSDNGTVSVSLSPKFPTRRSITPVSKDCVIESHTFRMTSDSNGTFRATVSAQNTNRAHIFMLDRPDRLLAILPSS